MGKGPGPQIYERIYVANEQRSAQNLDTTVTFYDPDTHTPTTTLTRFNGEPLADNNAPRPIAAYSGYVYVGDFFGNKVDIYKADGVDNSEPVAQFTSGLFNPEKIVGYEGHIYVLDGVNNQINIFKAYNGSGSSPTKVETYSFQTVDVQGEGETDVAQSYDMIAYANYIYVSVSLARDDPYGFDGAIITFNKYTAEGTTDYINGVVWFPTTNLAVYNNKLYGVTNDGVVDIFNIDTVNDGQLTYFTTHYFPTDVMAFNIVLYKEYAYVYVFNTNSSFGQYGFMIYNESFTTEIAEIPVGQGMLGYPIGIIAYDDHIYAVTLPDTQTVKQQVAVMNAYNPGEEPEIVFWETDTLPSFLAAYNSDHPQGNLYIDQTGSNVV